MKQTVLLSWLVSGFLVVALYGQNDWKTYGNDPGHTKFSTLAQITPQNVTRLTKAWEFDTKTPGLTFTEGSTVAITRP